MSTPTSWPLSRLAAELSNVAVIAAELNGLLDRIFINAPPEMLARLNGEPTFQFDGADLAMKASELSAWCRVEAITDRPPPEQGYRRLGYAAPDGMEPPAVTEQPGFDSRDDTATEDYVMGH